MKGYRTLKEIKKGCLKVESCAAGSDRFMYKCFPFMAQQMAEINDKLSKLVIKHQKKNPSEYNLFIAEQIKSGKTFGQAVKAWREK